MVLSCWVNGDYIVTGHLSREGGRPFVERGGRSPFVKGVRGPFVEGGDRSLKGEAVRPLSREGGSCSLREEAFHRKGRPFALR